MANSSETAPGKCSIADSGESGQLADVHEADKEATWWRALRQDQDEQARTALIHAYLPYTRMMAAVYYKRRTHDETGFDDYFQLASMGLMESIDRYDPGKGVSFRTYCARRVHGAILDGLDALSEKNRQIAVRRSLQRERLESLAGSAGDDGDGFGHAEIDGTNLGSSHGQGAGAGAGAAADGGGTPDMIRGRSEGKGKGKGGGGGGANDIRHQEQLFRHLAQIGIGTALGILLEDTGMVGNPAAQDMRHPGSDISYFKRTQLQQLRLLLKQSLTQLGSAERAVIQAHYLAQTSFTEIAAEMGVTRGRISQLHQQALKKLRAAVAGRPECDLDI